MPYNPKHAFVKALRDAKINHVTSKNYVKIASVSITFFEEIDTITFRDNRASAISYSTPFSQPYNILFKYRWFTRYINKLLSKSSNDQEKKLTRLDCSYEKNRLETSNHMKP